MGEIQFAIGTRFFKIMMPGFEETLKLPPAFCDRVKHEKSKRAILKSCKGKWVINVCRDDHDRIFFEDGWPRFSDDHGLSLGDFLVFEHTGKLHFNVVICDITGSQKQCLLENQPNREEDENPDVHVPLSFHSETPSFAVEMRPYLATKRAMVNIPGEFLKSNHLKGKQDVTLRDPQERRWAVKLIYPKGRGVRMTMTTGWHDFYVSNNLRVGDLCVFELNPASLTSTTIFFDVQIFPCNTNH